MNTDNNAITIVLNSGIIEGMSKWMDENSIHPYGRNYGYLWVSWDGKFGNRILTTEELFKLYNNDR